MTTVKPRITAIIPARLHSTRLPEKVLMLLNGKSLVQHVHDNLKELNVFDQIIIATDHAKIYDHVKSWEGKVVMTDNDHVCGTDRIAEVAAKLDTDYILNVQADEPMLTREHILPVIDLVNHQDFTIGTAYTSIQDETMFVDPNTVKVVVNSTGNCLYFSRSAIPYNRDGMTDLSLAKRHLGIYLFRRATLLDLVSLAPTKLELSEKLEQLRWLDYGHRMFGAEIPNTALSIDTIEDYRQVQALLES